MHRKGYATESSGFGGDGDLQALDGYFEIDDPTKAEIEKLGAKIEKGKNRKNYTQILFKTPNPDINEIKIMWDKIISLIPSKDSKAPPSISGASEDFRKEFSASRTDIEKMSLKRSLELMVFAPEWEEKMKQRLDELTKDKELQDEKTIDRGLAILIKKKHLRINSN